MLYMVCFGLTVYCLCYINISLRMHIFCKDVCHKEVHERVQVMHIVDSHILFPTQIISIVDRHWVEAEGGGGVGKVPSSVLVPCPPPTVPANRTLFVAYAEFMPSQPGDLGLVRGELQAGRSKLLFFWLK